MKTIVYSFISKMILRLGLKFLKNFHLSFRISLFSENLKGKKSWEIGDDLPNFDHISKINIFLKSFVEHNDFKLDYNKLSENLTVLLPNSNQELFQKQDMNAFILLSLLFIKTKNNFFSDYLMKNKKILQLKTIKLKETIKSKLKESIISEFKNERSQIEIDKYKETSEEILSYLFVELSFCQVERFRVQENFDYDFLKAYIDLHFFHKNQTTLNEIDDLRKEILYKLLLFFPIYSVNVNFQSEIFPILKEIYFKLQLFQLYQNLVIEQFHLIEIEPKKIALFDSQFLDTLFSLSEDTENFEKFLLFLQNISDSVDFSISFSCKIWMYFGKFNFKETSVLKSISLYDILISNYFGLLMSTLTIIQENLQEIPFVDFYNIVCLICKENLTKYNYVFFMIFWEKALAYIDLKLWTMNFKTKVNLIHCLAKNCFLTDVIRKEILSLIKPKKIEIFYFDWKSTIKLLQSGIMLKIFNTENIEEILDIMKNKLKKQYHINEFLSKLASPLLKIHYSNYEFWLFYFKNLENMILDPKMPKFPIFLVLKAFPIIFSKENENISEKMSPEKIFSLSELYKNTMKNSKFVMFLKLTLKDHFEEIPKEKKMTGSFLEGKINNSLKKLGLNFIEQAESMIFNLFLKLLVL